MRRRHNPAAFTLRPTHDDAAGVLAQLGALLSIRRHERPQPAIDLPMAEIETRRRHWRQARRSICVARDAREIFKDLLGVTIFPARTKLAHS